MQGIQYSEALRVDGACNLVKSMPRASASDCSMTTVCWSCSGSFLGTDMEFDAVIVPCESTDAWCPFSLGQESAVMLSATPLSLTYLSLELGLRLKRGGDDKCGKHIVESVVLFDERRRREYPRRRLRTISAASRWDEWSCTLCFKMPLSLLMIAPCLEESSVSI